MSALTRCCGAEGNVDECEGHAAWITEVLGAADAQISTVGLGCNNFGTRLDEHESAAVVHAALDAGITFFDTADIYGDTRSETFLGRALGHRRHDVLVATKIGLPIGQDLSRAGGSRRWVMEAVEGSLRRLDRDYIDLYQFHHPDPETPIEDTLGALADLMAEGKVRSIGCSNVSAADLGAALHATTAFGLPKFLCVQNELSLLKPGARADILPACREADVAFLPYFPLASGLLSGKYVPGRPPPADSRLASWGEAGLRVLNGEVMDSIARLKAWAEERGHTILELAFAWLLAERQVGSVIAGATTPEQVRANVAAAGWALDRQDLVAIDDLLPQFQRDAASGTIA